MVTFDGRAQKIRCFVIEDKVSTDNDAGTLSGLASQVHASPVATQSVVASVENFAALRALV